MVVNIEVITLLALTATIYNMTAFRPPRGGNTPRRIEMRFIFVVWKDGEKTSFLAYSDRTIFFF